MLYFLCLYTLEQEEAERVTLKRGKYCLLVLPGKRKTGSHVMCEEIVKARKNRSERSQCQNNALGMERAEQFCLIYVDCISGA